MYIYVTGAGQDTLEWGDLCSENKKLTKGFKKEGGSSDPGTPGSATDISLSIPNNSQ